MLMKEQEMSPQAIKLYEEMIARSNLPVKEANRKRHENNASIFQPRNAHEILKQKIKRKHGK